MSEPDKPKRSWFRFHLTTAVLMMFSAGGLLWLNSPQRFTADMSRQNEWVHQGFMVGWLERGWPFSVYEEDAILISAELESSEELRARIQKKWQYFPHGGEPNLHYVKGNGLAYSLNETNRAPLLMLNAFLNGIIGLASLLGIGLLSEWPLRRREGRKP